MVSSFAPAEHHVKIDRLDDQITEMEVCAKHRFLYFLMIYKLLHVPIVGKCSRMTGAVPMNLHDIYQWY